MAGKKKPEGAPAYMALYTTLMIVLLGFFIVMNSLSQEREAGFHDGIGDIKNAFGLEGGIGLLQFRLFNFGDGFIPLARRMKKSGGRAGFRDSILAGRGGGGMIDEDTDARDAGEYIRISVPFRFQGDSDVLPSQMAEYFKVAGMGLAGFDDVEFVIRVFCGESTLEDRNRRLATRRAAAISRYLNRACMIPAAQMCAVGYSSMRYFRTDIAESKFHESDRDQMIFLYIYQGSGDQSEAG